MSERKGETKRQHYVPRMILRNFSEDGRRISLVANGRRIDNAGLRDQCQEDYFYGADQVMEKSFATEEDRMAGFFGDLAPARFATLRGEDVQQLRFFILYQYARTRGAAEHLNKFTGAFIKEAIRDALAVDPNAEVTPEDLDSVDVGFERAQDESIWLASKSAPVLADMGVKFVTTARTPGFVIADHPVVAYNLFAEHHSILSHYPTRTGLAAKGLQLFMPLSPSMMLAVFDPATYRYGGKGSVCTAGPLDVAHLNRMQAVNAHSCFYFDSRRMTESALEDLDRARRSHPSMYKKNVATSSLTPSQDGKMGRFVVVHKTELRLGAKLSFVGTIDGHSYEDYEGPSVPVRSWELLEAAKLYGKALEEEVASRRAAKESGPPSDRPGSVDGSEGQGGAKGSPS